MLGAVSVTGGNYGDFSGGCVCDASGLVEGLDGTVVRVGYYVEVFDRWYGLQMGIFRQKIIEEV